MSRNANNGLSSRSPEGRAANPGKFSSSTTILLVVALALALVHQGASGAAPPAGWYQVNDDGFGSPFASTQSLTELFAFDGGLLAKSNENLLKMNNVTNSGGQFCQEWLHLASDAGRVAVLGSYLYMTDTSGNLWWTKGTTPASWVDVTSTGTMGGSDPAPLVLFKGQIYGVLEAGSAFEIWRSQDLGAATMTWQKVVANSFGDPKNNQGVDFMAGYMGKVYAGTHTLKGMFGDPKSYASGGIEVWESATGDLGSWKQVNVDGFGSQFMGCIDGQCQFPVNQVVGSWAVYQPPGAAVPYLYLGTKSHYGGEVWRYDGSGVKGWTDVTPPWGGQGFFANMDPSWKALRFEAMAVYGGDIYAAEGFPSGRLARYNGSNWSEVVLGPDPFSPENKGLGSLTVLGGQIYVSTTKHSSAKFGDQVWGYPFSKMPPRCIAPRLPELLPYPPKIRWIVPEGLIELFAWIKNDGGPIEQEYAVGFFLDGEPVHVEPGPPLGPGDEVEIPFSYDVAEGEHNLVLVVDVNGQVEEQDEGNNEFAFDFFVPSPDMEVPEEPGPWEIPPLEIPGHEVPGRIPESIPEERPLEMAPGGRPGEPEPTEVRGEIFVDEMRPVCGPEASHELVASWRTAGITAPLWLELILPGGAVQGMEVEGPQGSAPLDLNLPEGGTLELNLRAEGAGVVAKTSVNLEPCRREWVG